MLRFTDHVVVVDDDVAAVVDDVVVVVVVVVMDPALHSPQEVREVEARMLQLASWTAAQQQGDAGGCPSEVLGRALAELGQLRRALREGSPPLSR